VSPHDPVSLLRTINTPARGIGKTTVEHLETYAREQGCTLWSAIGQMLDGKGLPARAEAALRSFRNLAEALTAEVEDNTPLGDVVKDVIERTGYRGMLESEGTPSAESRLENLDELINAAVEAAVRGENLSEFLDHAALVAESDYIDEHAQVSLLTVHNAKGLEFPVVFIAGLEDGLFPHARSVNSPTLMEEERRLFYVGMTRAQKRLVLTWAAARRKYGGGALLSSIPSGFLSEVPPELTENLGARGPEVDLFSEAFEVREAAKRNTYTGKTYNSLEAVAQFFQERGKQPPAPSPRLAISDSSAVRKPVERPRKKKRFGAGSTVRHPRYGTGLVLRREGEGDDAKLTVSFPGYGLKKLVAKYAGLTLEE
jgi:DNA helicase-2/ATP-dependent DNA helicase PcrA